jgi:2,4-dienoyl-CoA reductase-like NADH-dependent reductase (Old Yellow Enzyme family)
MDRRDYVVFAEGKIGPMELKNRIVRSATVDAYSKRDADKCGEQTIATYAELAQGGVGLIVTGDIQAVSFDSVDGLSRLADAVHRTDSDCRIVVQLSAYDGMPSDVPSPFATGPVKVLTRSEIAEVVQRLAAVIASVKTAGFDGVELHAAHGHGLLSYFLSPYTNRRTDEYGGSAHNRTRIIREIVDGARSNVGDFPILAKVNCTDNVEGGIDMHSFPEQAAAIADCGLDAVEISGGSVHCLVRSEDELGFPPRPCPEAHTRINTVAKQSYFLAYAEAVNLGIPVILAGGNRDIERMENAVRGGSIDFFAMCRPLINEPDLPDRWLRGEGTRTTHCISCNACLYPYMEPERVTTYCVYKTDKQLHREAVRWLHNWIPNRLAERAR